METESLLAMFPAVPTEQWERAIRESVPGPDYSAKLIWHPEEGLAVKPYYRAEDLAGLAFVDALPGQRPYARGTRCDGGWRICESICAIDPEEANRLAVSAVSGGAEEIAFRGVGIESGSDLALLFANLNSVAVRIETASHASLRLIQARLKSEPHGADLSMDLDPLDDCDFSAEIIRTELTKFRPFVVDASGFCESGAGAIEETAFALSSGVEFLAEMGERGIEAGRAASALVFAFATGPQFFVQIAKLRAFRMAWAQVIDSFGAKGKADKALIYAHPVRWNTTVYDRQVNALRATTEALAAILGGADSVTIAPYDQCCGGMDENGPRLARNTQLILKHETLLDRVADPLGGSYLIEALTDSIGRKGWKLFQELEGAGGFRKAMAAGIIPAVLKRRTKARDVAVASRSCVLTGTNRFADASEKAPACGDAWKVDDLRAAVRFEELRRHTEDIAARRANLPLIVRAEIGDVKMRNIRSQFAADFLACAGFTSEARPYAHAAQIAECEAELVVLCSADSEYLSIARELMPILRSQRSQMRVVVAGNPETAGELRSLGVIGFVHLRSDAIAVLSEIQQQMGMKDQDASGFYKDQV